VTVTRRGKVAWTGKVPVAANQRVIVHINDGHQVTKNWPRGTELKTMNRFYAGKATASVVVAPVSGTISANPAKINCGQSAELKWASVETIDSEITHMSPVPREGQATVSPKQTTTYDLTATGPGGVLNTSTTLELNPVAAQLEATQQKDTITLTWSTSNADSITLEPLGPVEASGTRSIPAPKEGGPPTYTLHASNMCGASEVKRASAHLIAVAEPKPIPTVVIKSVYFPTDYPGQNDPSVGLLRSQQEELSNVAAEFAKYLESDPGAKLSITGHADERGPNNYNQSLSERRVQLVKEFLVSKGIAADKIETSAVGETEQLDKEAVNQLQTNNPNPAPEAHVKDPQTTWLAYNRRVDIILLPKNEPPLRFYPNQAPDSNILWQREKPDPKTLEQNKNK